jgi:hypothetical protein
MVIVEGETNTVQSEILEELSIGIGKEVFQELKERDVKTMPSMKQVQTLSKKKPDLFSPIAIASASRI